jgi:hypothetical protein
MPSDSSYVAARAGTASNGHEAWVVKNDGGAVWATDADPSTTPSSGGLVAPLNEQARQASDAGADLSEDSVAGLFPDASVDDVSSCSMPKARTLLPGTAAYCEQNPNSLNCVRSSPQHTTQAATGGSSGNGNGGNNSGNNGAGGGNGNSGGGGGNGGRGNGGQFGGGRDPAVVQACTDLTTLLHESENGPVSESLAERTIRPWNHLQFRRNANLNGDAHLIYADVFLTPPVPQATLISDLLRMKRDCAKEGFR